YQSTLFNCETNIFVSLWRAGRYLEAERVARRGVELGEKLARDHPAFPLDRDRLSLLICQLADLSSCFPEERFHNPGQALKLARRAVELKPEYGTALPSLGWAQYRLGDWKGCIASLTENEGDHLSLLAMAYWQLGDKAKARDLFDRADQWLKGYEE